MKTQITTLTILLISIVVLIAACSNPTPAVLTEVAVLRDVTDTNIVRPEASGILKLYGLNKNKWNGGVFRYSDISDVSMSEVKEASIEKANPWWSNEFQRKDEIRGFEQKVADLLLEADTVSGRENSSVYLAIGKELSRLSESTAQRRVLIVYSDLMENAEISFYRKKDFSLLKEKPEVIKERFEKLLPLPPLSGVEIFFIYRPKDTRSDERFRIVSEFYRQLLQGAKVKISANL